MSEEFYYNVLLNIFALLIGYLLGAGSSWKKS